jgi:hypothetical protein
MSARTVLAVVPERRKAQAVLKRWKARCTRAARRHWCHTPARDDLLGQGFASLLARMRS